MQKLAKDLEVGDMVEDAEGNFLTVKELGPGIGGRNTITVYWREPLEQEWSVVNKTSILRLKD